MKILFTHSYFLRFDPKQFHQSKPYPPLATLYAIQLMKENGFEVEFFDNMFSHSAKEINEVIDSFQPDILVIYDDSFNFLTKMCLTNMQEAAFEIQKYAKEKGCTVITSSSDSTDHSEKYLENKADYIIVGEAEITLLELCNAIKYNKSDNEIKKINGLRYLENNKLYDNNHRKVMTDLDQLSPPDWEAINIQPYKDMWLKNHGYFSINFVTTRGCPYKCNWCAKPIYGNRYNTHSAENIAKQIKIQQERMGFTHIWFADDIFGLKPGWITDFDKHMNKLSVTVKYKIQNRVDLLLKENNIEHLANSGCETVWVGAESGSQKILDAMDKGTQIEQIKVATDLLKKHNIEVGFFLQFGYLDETIEDIKLTIDMINNLIPDDIGISVSYPLPGTKFYEKVKNDMKDKTNWTDSDELALMFKNTYKKEFYKELYTYIHKVHRKRKSIMYLKERFSFKPKDIKQILKLVYLTYGEFIYKKRLKAIEPDVRKSF